MRKLALLLLLWGFSASAEPREVLTYVTDEGTVSFTDELKQVPKKYREEVAPVTVDGMGDYQKGTRSDDGAGRKAVEARLSHLRSIR